MSCYSSLFLEAKVEQEGVEPSQTFHPYAIYSPLPSKHPKGSLRRLSIIQSLCKGNDDSINDYKYTKQGNAFNLRGKLKLECCNPQSS